MKPVGLPLIWSFFGSSSRDAHCIPLTPFQGGHSLMAGSWKSVRVFISSTFRDMHAERDHLIKVVFPALRERLEKYRIYLDDIDLRWGVTKEQAENDQVLDLCLQQIDECRPFFIGILGERYGWVPTQFPVQALSRQGW